MAVKLLLVLSLLVVWFVPPQPSVTTAREPQCENGWCEDTFEAGGRVHNIGYPEDLLDESLAAREAVAQSIITLQPIFSSDSNVPFQITITVTPTEHFNWAEASPSRILIPETDGISTIAIEGLQCHIVVFDMPEPSIWLYVLAHEMAHCYQFQYIENLAFNFPDDYWWVEGGAEWLASLVYPELTPTAYSIGGRQEMFANSYFTSLFSKSYDAVYFWQFLEAELGYEAAIALMMQMPAALQASDYIGYLRSAIPDLGDVFQQYAISLYNNLVMYQPPYNSMHQTLTLPSALPLGEDIGTQLLAVDYRTYSGIVLPPDKALRIIVTGTEPLELRATLLMGSTIHWLQDGQPADLCNPPDTFTVGLSRIGELATEGEAGRIELMEIDAESATCLEQEVVIPECLVGRWIVTELPDVPMPTEVTMMWERENFYIEFRSDGTFDGVVRNLVSIADVEGMNMETSMSFVVHGAIVVEPDDVAVDQFHVVEYQSEIESASVIVTIDGETQDLTDMVLGMGAEESVFPVFRSLTCIDETHLQYSAIVEGTELVWLTERAQ